VKRSGDLWLGAGLAAALLLCGGGVEADEKEWAEAEAATLAALAKRGRGIDRAELAPLPKSNGAPALGRAFAAVGKIPRDDLYACLDTTRIYGGDLSQTYHGDLGREAQVELVARGLKAAKQVFPALEEALRAEAITFPTEWSRGFSGKLGAETMPAWETVSKEVAYLLVARAVVAREAGRHAEAWTSLEQVFTLSQRLRQPTPVWRLVRIGLQRIGIEGLEWMLGAGPPPPADVRERLLARFRGLEQLPPLHGFVRAELVLVLVSFEGRAPLEACEELAAGFAFAKVPVFTLSASEQRTWVARERALCVERYAAVIEAVDAELGKVPERLNALPRIEPTEDPQRKGLLTSLIDPRRAVRVVLRREQEHREQLRKAAQLLGERR